MCYTAQRVRVAHRGSDRHLRGQVFVPPGSTQASLTAKFCRTTVHQRKEAQFTKPVTAYRFSACMHSQAMSSGDLHSITRASFLIQHHFLKTVFYMMGHSCHINGETTVLERPISLRLSCLTVWSHLGCMMSRRLSKDILPSTPCLRCRRLESTIRAVIPWGQNDYRPAFFISTSNYGKNDRDPAKDPRIPGKIP